MLEKLDQRLCQWTPIKQKKFYYFSKFLFMCGAVGMILISALRFTIINQESVHDTIVDLYFLFLGLIVGLSQLNINKVVTKFRFLNYHWGKFALSFFLACMSFSTGMANSNIAFVQYIVSIYFLIVCVMFLILAVIDRDRDIEQMKIDNKDMLQNSILFKK